MHANIEKFVLKFFFFFHLPSPLPFAKVTAANADTAAATDPNTPKYTACILHGLYGNAIKISY